VIEATARTEALLDGLMVLARTQRGLLRPERLDLAAVARSAAGAVSEEARAADVRVRLELDGAATAGDRRLLERLVANLVENAVRHNRPGGFVRVSTVRRNGSALVRVSNTGPQVSTEAAGRLAEPFERLDRSGDGRGAGLGLSIVHSVAVAHGGTLRLRPREAGGLDVEVALPSPAVA
jgi:signal transduction histidine kinase